MRARVIVTRGGGTLASGGQATEEALAAALDVAAVNGHVFVNNSAVGVNPDMVRLREVEQARTGRSKRRAMFTASLASLRHFHRHRLWISAPGLAEPLRYRIRPKALTLLVPAG